MSRSAGPLGSMLFPASLDDRSVAPFDLAAATGGIVASGRMAGAPQATGLSLRASGSDSYHVCVCSQAGRVLMEIGPFGDADIAAAWKQLSASSGLPFMVLPDETDAAPVRKRRVSCAERRKRLAVLGSRRPRFLTRRKTGRLGRTPSIHREGEIAGGHDL